MKQRLTRIWREWLRSVLLIILVVTSLRSAVADWNDVPTGSMKPTILEGDRIVVSKLAYDLRLPFIGIRLLSWDDPKRGDIVVLRSPSDSKRLVKRVVGQPGDVVEMRDNRLAVNGEAVPYSPVEPAMILGHNGDSTLRVLATEDLGERSHAVMITPGSRAQSSFGPLSIPDGRYFVMGDNRDESLDSRHFGLVDRDLIVGRATAVAASLDPKDHFLPRWERFFHPLR